MADLDITHTLGLVFSTAIGILAAMLAFDHTAGLAVVAVCAGAMVYSAVVLIRRRDEPRREAPVEQQRVVQLSSYRPSPEYPLNNAIDEIREQRKLTQALWDVPAAVVLVDKDGRVDGRIGGALRSAGYPEELLSREIPPTSEIGQLCATVLHDLRRIPTEIERNGRTFSVVASPWISMSGRVRGVVLVLLSSDDAAMTDESESAIRVEYAEPKPRTA